MSASRICFSTPLMLAVEKGFESLVQILVEGGHADLFLKDSQGWTARDKAQINGFDAIHKYLLKRERESQGESAAPSSDAEQEDVDVNGEDEVVPMTPSDDEDEQSEQLEGINFNRFGALTQTT